MEGDVMSMHDIFGFKQTGVDDDRRGPGLLLRHGHPAAMHGEAGDLAASTCPPKMFERRMLGVLTRPGGDRPCPRCS